MYTIWHFTKEKLGAGEPVMLIIVTEVHGSSPGKTGFKMAVGKSGEKAGTIGGGPMEYALEALAVESLQEVSPKVFMKRQVHSSDAGEDASGLICAGEQHHVFVKLFPEDLDTILRIDHLLSKGIPGNLHISPSGMDFTETGTDDPMRPHQPGGDLLYTETLWPEPVLYIFGGGHVSIPVTRIARILGFRVEVYDDREGLSTMEENTDASHREVIRYSQAASRIIAPESSFVCIMTVSHASDQEVLEQMLPLPLRYLGMIGSRNKVGTIFANLLKKGADAAALRRVDAPMGIPINSETPPEIAVSIAAEIIRKKNEKRHKVI